MDNLLEGQSFREIDLPIENSPSLITEDEKTEIEDYATDDEFRKRFQQYLEEGSVDVCPISQIIIVGENGVGKTTLLYRLQGRSQEEIDEIKTTIGVDCHTQKFGFIVTNDQLKINQEGKSHLAVSPENVLAEGNSAQNSKEEPIIKEDDANDVKEIGDGGNTSSFKSHYRHLMSKEDEVPPDERKSAREGLNALQASQKTEEETIIDEGTNTTEGAKTFKDKSAGNIEESYPSASEKNTNYEQTDENTNMNTRVKTTKSVSRVPGKNLKKNLMSIVQQKLAENLDIGMQLRKKNDVVLNVLDFAGQGAYYASHQTYIRKNAIYVIVFDVSRDLDERKVVPFGRPCSLFSCWTQKGKYHITLEHLCTRLCIYNTVKLKTHLKTARSVKM
ncbi:probable serine/threonine-protein kinase roco6 [Ostrea edulis]|uniref:probable serine/threonine-protein kinase roco6 n=1 Tax=Ostrea edulis TaxID=37623 RepID=UPI0024AF88BE|nr:probable serine/threonine-protein kinase roco6 [Ostrea edulis]